MPSDVPENLTKAIAAADLRRILELSPAGVLVVDREGMIRFANRAAGRLFGRTVDVLSGQPFGFPFDLEGPTELDIIRPDDINCIGEMHVSEIEWDSQSAYLMTIFDVTQRMADELTIRQINEQLSQKTRDMERFVFAASHDLKSPLVTIGGYVKHLDNALVGGDAGAASQFTQRIHAAADRMRRHVDDLLEVCRVGHADQHRVNVDLDEVAKQVVREQGGEIERAGANVVVHDGLPRVMAIRGQMLQMFDNLLGNALRYGCSDGVRKIEIGGDSNLYEVHAYVRDHGPGIDPQFHEVIFDLFKRLQAEGDGTGVGLTIVQRIVENHGGRIWVTSTPGEGATFHVVLPRRPARP